MEFELGFNEDLYSKYIHMENGVFVMSDEEFGRINQCVALRAHFMTGRAELR